MCRQHCKGCTRENIIFDQTGEVGEFLDQGYRTDNAISDTVRAMDIIFYSCRFYGYRRSNEKKHAVF